MPFLHPAMLFQKFLFFFVFLEFDELKFLENFSNSLNLSE